LAALCRQRLRRGLIHYKWHFSCYPIFGGWGGTVLLLLAAGVKNKTLGKENFKSNFEAINEFKSKSF